MRRADKTLSDKLGGVASNPGLGLRGIGTSERIRERSRATK
jgi:hypothetical protein